MRHLFTLLTASSLLLSACAPEGIGQGFSTQEPQAVVKNTAPENIKAQAQNYENLEIILGATKPQNLAVTYASDIHRMILRGELELTPVGNSKKPLVIPIDLAGIADNEGYVYLKEYDAKTVKVPGVRLGAKATCLGEDLNCATSFIDVYIEFEGRIYHHQLESTLTAPTAPVVPPATPANPSKTEDHKKNPPTKEDDSFFKEDGEGDDDSKESHYVGNPLEDIEKILGIKAPTPTKPPKKDQPKQEPTPVKPPKKDDGKTSGKDDDKDDDDSSEKPSSPFSVTNQVVGSVNAGRLEKAVNMHTIQTSMKDPGFKILRPTRAAHFAASEMGYAILLMAEQTKKFIPGGYLAVGDISKEKGGTLGSHKSHTNGLDVDVAYYFKNKSFLGYFTSAVVVGKNTHGDFMVDEQWRLFKSLVKTQMVDRIFIHKVLKKSFCEAAIKSGELTKDTNSLAAETLRRLIIDPAHDNHFHLRLKCSKSQPRCRQMTDPAVGSGCF